MSRYNSGNYAYGYDHPLQEYFLQENKGEETVEIVGCLSRKKGTSRNLLEAIYALEIEIPEEHKTQIELDLPF